MNGELRSFNFEGRNPVRVVMRGDDPWFAAPDASKALGYRDAHNAVRILDEDEKGTHQMSTPGGNQDVTVISESGLYTLILRSDKPEAKRFRKWITSEVLPAIRKTGAYVAPGWVGLAQAEKAIGVARQTILHRLEAHRDLPFRIHEGRREVQLEALRAHFAAKPVQHQMSAGYRKGVSTRRAIQISPMPDAAQLAELRQIYGPKKAQTVLHQMNPKVFPAPATLEGGAR